MCVRVCDMCISQGGVSDRRPYIYVCVSHPAAEQSSLYKETHRREQKSKKYRMNVPEEQRDTINNICIQEVP